MFGCSKKYRAIVPFCIAALLLLSLGLARASTLNPLSFDQIVTMADVIAVGHVVGTDLNPPNGTGIATIKLDKRIKGDPFGHTITVPFFLQKAVERKVATFETNRQYLLFLLADGPMGANDDYAEYHVLDTAVGGDLGLATINHSMVTARTYPAHLSVRPVPLAAYIQAIRHSMVTSPPNLGQQVQRFVQGLRQGQVVYGDRDALMLGVPEYDVVIFRADLRNLLHDNAIPLLKPYLHDKDVRVRRGVFDVLRLIGNQKALPLLNEGLKDRDMAVRRMAVEGILKAGQWQSVPLLIRSLNTRVNDKGTDQLNAQVNQALRQLIVQHRYGEWNKGLCYLSKEMPFSQLWSAIVEADALPNYLSWDPPKKRLRAIQQWHVWFKTYKSEFPA